MHIGDLDVCFVKWVHLLVIADPYIYSHTRQMRQDLKRNKRDVAHHAIFSSACDGIEKKFFWFLRWFCIATTRWMMNCECTCNGTYAIALCYTRINFIIIFNLFCVLSDRQLKYTTILCCACCMPHDGVWKRRHAPRATFINLLWSFLWSPTSLFWPLWISIDMNIQYILLYVYINIRHQ